MSSFRGQWLPGDKRGFRSRKHIIHSSGNYKARPPIDEHAGLRAHAKTILKRTIILNHSQCEIVIQAIADKFDSIGLECAALAITPTHAHALIHIGDADAVRVFARAKQHASHALRSELSGHIWGRGAHVVRMTSEEQLQQSITYILNHEREGGVVWVHQPAPSLEDSLRSGVQS